MENFDLDMNRIIDEAFTVQEKMDECGGGFERALAKLIRRADAQNLARIYIAFNDLWNKWLNW